MLATCNEGELKLAWASVPGSGDLVMSSADNLVTGTVSAQNVITNILSGGSARVGFAFIGSPTTQPTSDGVIVLPNIETLPTSGFMGAGDGAFACESGNLVWVHPTGTITVVASD